MVNGILSLVYFAVWLILAVGTFILFWRKGPDFKKRYYHKVCLFNSFAIGFFMLALVWPHPIGIAMVLIGGGSIGYLNFKYTKICDSCGKIIQQNPFSLAKYCEKCGSKLIS